MDGRSISRRSNRSLRRRGWRAPLGDMCVLPLATARLHSRGAPTRQPPCQPRPPSIAQIPTWAWMRGPSAALSPSRNLEDEPRAPSPPPAPDPCRSQFDLMYDLPGGIEGLAAAIARVCTKGLPPDGSSSQELRAASLPEPAPLFPQACRTTPGIPARLAAPTVTRWRLRSSPRPSARTSRMVTLWSTWTKSFGQRALRRGGRLRCNPRAAPR